MKIRSHLFRIAVQLVAVTPGFAAVQAGAQPAYPTKVIRLVNPNQPGGNSDKRRVQGSNPSNYAYTT